MIFRSERRRQCEVHMAEELDVKDREKNLNFSINI